MSKIKRVFSENSINSEIIKILNSFSTSIKEYFEVSKYNLKESNNSLNILEKGIKNIEDSINDISNKKSFDINVILQNLVKAKRIINQLIKNSDSNDNNLENFFKNSNFLFKKLEINRKENLDQLFENDNSKNKNNMTKSAKNILNRIENNDKYNTLDYEYNKNTYLNINKNEKIDYNTLIYYIKKLADYNEIIGKISFKDKNSYMNLQKMLLDLLEINKNIRYYKIEDDVNYQSETEIGFHLDKIKQKYNFDKFLEKQNKENKVIGLDNKAKELENKRQLSMKLKNYKYLKDKIIFELIKINNDYSLIDNSGNFEQFIMNVIKKLSHEINLKNEIIKKLEINNNALIHDISSKINNIKDKENEILNIKKENEIIKIRYEEANQLNLKNQIKLLNYEKNLMQGEFNKFKLLNININNNQINNIDSLINIEKDNEAKELKKEIEIQKNYVLINKNEHIKEINLLNNKIQNLSRQITLKNQEIIFMQKQILENKNKDDNKLKKLNNILKKDIEDKSKEIISLKNKLNAKDNDKKLIELNKIISDYRIQIELLNKQISELKINNSEIGKSNKSELIMDYKNEINELNKIIMRNNTIIEEKDRMIKELKELMKDNNENNVNNEKKEDNSFNESKSCEETSILRKTIKKNQESMIDNDNNSIEIIVANNIENELDLIKKEKMGLENKISLLNHEIESLNLINEKLMAENKLNPNNEILHKKEDEIESLKLFIINLQNELEKAEKDNEILKLKFNSLQKKLDEVNKENKILKDNLEINKKNSGKIRNDK